MNDLSPVAQAAIDVTEKALSDFKNYGHNYIAAGVAVALRAAAYAIDWESGDPRFLLENTAA